MRMRRLQASPGNSPSRLAPHAGGIEAKTRPWPVLSLLWAPLRCRRDPRSTALHRQRTMDVNAFSGDVDQIYVS